MLGQAFNALPPLERARRYREMAAEALALSSGAPTAQGRALYLSLSNDWHSLAITLENESGEKGNDGVAEKGSENGLDQLRRR